MDAHHFEWPTPPPLLDDDDCWRKGSWTSHEDKLLTDHVNLHGEGKWNSVSKLTGLRRSGKSCRLRWVNYLRPDLKRGNISPQEEAIIQELHALWGNRWSAIARSLPGRTDNEIKNYWRTHFKNSKPSKSVEKARARFLLRRQQQQQRQRQRQQQKKKKKKEGEVVLQQQQQQQQQEDHGNQNDDGDNEEEEEEEREMMKKRAEEASAVVLENEMAMAEMAYMLRGGGNLDGGYASDGGSNDEYVLWGGLWYLDD